MNRYWLIAISVATLLGGWAAPAHAIDELWERSIKAVKGQKIYVPGVATYQEKVVDKEGNVAEVTEARFEIENSGARGRARLLKCTVDGEDVTQEAREDLEREANVELQEFDFEMPYCADDPLSNAVGIQEDLKMINGVECRGYDFIYREEGHDFKGIVWIDPTSALPLEISSIITSVPFKEDGVQVMSLNRTTHYILENGVWKIKNESEDVWVKVRVLFKNVLAVIQTQTDYSNHWILNVS